MSSEQRKSLIGIRLFTPLVGGALQSMQPVEGGPGLGDLVNSPRFQGNNGLKLEQRRGRGGDSSGKPAPSAGTAGCMWGLTREAMMQSTSQKQD